MGNTSVLFLSRKDACCGIAVCDAGPRRKELFLKNLASLRLCVRNNSKKAEVIHNQMLNEHLTNIKWDEPLAHEIVERIKLMAWQYQIY